MEAAKAWEADSVNNAESFDVEAVEGKENVCALVINGFYKFILSFDAPFAFTRGEGCAKGSKAVKAILNDSNNNRKETEGGAAAIKEACNFLTKAYQKHSDALDSEAEEELGINDDEEDVAEQMEAEAAAMKKRIEDAKAAELAKLTPEERAQKKIVEEYIMELKSANQGDLSANAAMRILTDMARVKSMESDKRGWYMKNKAGSIKKWEAHLTMFDKGCPLDKDMDKWSQRNNVEKAIVLELTVNKDYPYKPPYVRVLRPQFMFRTGHVTMGGAVCMLPLTTSGWSPSFEIESIIEMVRTNILDSNAAVDHDKGAAEYNEEESRQGFARLVQTHGWRHED